MVTIFGSERRRRGWLPLAGVGALALAAGLAGCGKNPAAAAKAGPGAGAMRAMPVQVQTLAEHPVEQTSQYPATLKSRRSATIYSQVTGYIRSIDVHSGQQVRAGELLMEVDPLKQQAAVGSQVAARNAQAATVAYDQQQLRREEALYESQVASRQELDQARATYNAAKAQLDSLAAQVKAEQVQLQYYRIAAPRDGIVGDIPVHLGDLVQNNTLLTTVDQPGTLEVYVYVPVEQALQLHLGLPVRLLNASGQTVASSQLDFISPQVDPATQTVLVKANVSDLHGQLRTLQYVTAEILWGAQARITVPVLTVQRINGLFFAFLAQPRGHGAMAAEVPIQVGPIVGNDYVVLSGLEPGEKLITSSLQFLVNGMPVMPLPGMPPGAGGAQPAGAAGRGGAAPR